MKEGEVYMERSRLLKKGSFNGQILVQCLCGRPRQTSHITSPSSLLACCAPCREMRKTQSFETARSYIDPAEACRFRGSIHSICPASAFGALKIGYASSKMSSIAKPQALSYRHMTQQELRLQAKKSNAFNSVCLHSLAKRRRCLTQSSRQRKWDQI